MFPLRNARQREPAGFDFVSNQTATAFHTRPSGTLNVRARYTSSSTKEDSP
jgi:hypothetical protein